MRWEDERYVRVYTRDTGEWMVLSWDARSVFLALLRKCDRAGILQVGKSGARGLAGLLGAPLEVVQRAIPELLDDGCLRQTEGAYVIPNFLTAQEAVSSDAQRKRDQRERDRARALDSGRETGQTVTVRDQTSQPVTDSHAASQAVTPSRAVPCRTEPNRAEPPPPASSAAPNVVHLRAQKPEEEEESPFWEFTQQERAKLGRGREEKPAGFDAWARTTEAEVGPERLSLAYCRYLADEDFRMRGWPMPVFQKPKVWRPRANDLRDTS